MRCPPPLLQTPFQDLDIIHSELRAKDIDRLEGEATKAGGKVGQKTRCCPGLGDVGVLVLSGACGCARSAGFLKCGCGRRWWGRSRLQPRLPQNVVFPVFWQVTFASQRVCHMARLTPR